MYNLFSIDFDSTLLKGGTRTLMKKPFGRWIGSTQRILEKMVKLKTLL